MHILFLIALSMLLLLPVMGTTQAVAGFIGKIYVSDDGGANYVEVGEATDVEISEQLAVYDATSHGSGGGEESVPGISSWGITLGSMYISSDAAQDKLDAGYTAKTKLLWRFDPEGTAGSKDRWSGAAYITDMKLTSPNKDLSKRSITLKGTGLLVKSAQ